MNDEFYEQLVKRENRTKKIIIYILTGIAAVAGILFGMMFMGITAVLVVALLIAALYQFGLKRLNLEYEYSMVNSEFQIDTIYNKEKRKTLFSIDVREAEIIAPCGHAGLKSFNPQKVYDATSGKKGKAVYSIMVKHDGRLCNILIEPNDIMLQQIKNWSGMKFAR